MSTTSCKYIKKKREKREKEQVLSYYSTYIQLEWHARDMPTRGECKEAHQASLIVRIYIRGCQIYSQLAISSNPKSYIVTYYT